MTPLAVHLFNELHALHRSTQSCFMTVEQKHWYILKGNTARRMYDSPYSAVGVSHKDVCTESRSAGLTLSKHKDGRLWKEKQAFVEGRNSEKFAKNVRPVNLH